MATKPIAHNLSSKWRSQDVKIQESADFTSLLLSNQVLAGLKLAGYQSPSPIQIEAIPVGRFGKDLVVQAKSGTGKTLVFSIIALEMILPDVAQPQVLIIAPTREIAHQICSVIQVVGSEFENLNCCTFIGGIPISDDKENVSGCQIAVGTPGRIKQLIKEGILKTNCIRLFVLDEADQLLETSFLSDVDEIFLTLPKDKQVIATSATYPQKLKKLADRYFRNPYLARLNIDELALLGIVHYVQTIDVSDMPMLVYQKKLEYLAKILTSISFSQCLVFCNLLSRVPQLTSDIKDWGFTTTSISSSKEQVDRLKAIDKLKLFKCKVLVSSDLTSRGIDAENVNLVINFDLPHSAETYLHRVGRAGRYGSRGLAVTLLLPKQSEAFKLIESSSSFSSYDLPDPIPQNLMNIRPQGFQGPEDGFETSSENSELPGEGIIGNLSDESGVDSTAGRTESVGSDLCQRQNEPSDVNEEISSTKCINSDLSQSKNGLNYDGNNGYCDEKIGSLESVQKENADSDACQEQKGASDEKVDSPENVESENPSGSKSAAKETETLPNNGSSSSDNNQELLAGIASFLAQVQPNDKPLSPQSGNQSKESLDGLYYQVFKSFAEENIPEIQTDNAVSSGETAIENKPSENSSCSIDDVKEPVEKETEKSVCSKVSKKPKNRNYSESSSESSTNADHSNYLDFSDSSSAYNIRYSSSTSSDSGPLNGLLNGMKFPFQSDYMAKGADGWKEVEFDPSNDTCLDVLKNMISSRQEENNTGEEDQASAHFLNNEVPETIKEENVKAHSSPDPAHKVLDCNPMSHNPTNASPALSGKSENSVPISPNSAGGHSQSTLSCSTGSRSQSCGRGSYASKGPKFSRSQNFQANHVGDQRAQDRNHPQQLPQYGQAQNHVQAYPVCNWHTQPDANAVSRCCQEAFNVGYNYSYANSFTHNCSHHRSHNACSHTNIQTFQNPHPYNSGNNSSSSNMWYDMFSKQWQQINNMCYSHQFNY